MTLHKLPKQQRKITCPQGSRGTINSLSKKKEKRGTKNSLVDLAYEATYGATLLASFPAELNCRIKCLTKLEFVHKMSKRDSIGRNTSAHNSIELMLPSLFKTK